MHRYVRNKTKVTYILDFALASQKMTGHITRIEDNRLSERTTVAKTTREKREDDEGWFGPNRGMEKINGVKGYIL